MVLEFFIEPFSFSSYEKFLSLELQSQLVRKGQLLDEAKHDLEGMNEYQVLMFFFN